jgi:hypothetical protein
LDHLKASKRAIFLLCYLNISSKQSDCIVIVFIFRERYRDLIEAADTITEMKNSAQNVRFSETVRHFTFVHNITREQKLFDFGEMGNITVLVCQMTHGVKTGDQHLEVYFVVDFHIHMRECRGGNSETCLSVPDLSTPIY